MAHCIGDRQTENVRDHSVRQGTGPIQRRFDKDDTNLVLTLTDLLGHHYLGEAPSGMQQSSGDLHVWPGPGTGLMEPETPNWKGMNRMIEDDSVIHGESVTATWGE